MKIKHVLLMLFVFLLSATQIQATTKHPIFNWFKPIVVKHIKWHFKPHKKPTPIPTAVPTNTPTPTATLIPTPTSTPTPTPTNTPTPTPLVKRAFVTSSDFDGNLLGCSGADIKCQDHANKVGLGGSWTAWCQDDTTLAKDRITQADGGYKRLDGVMVANSFNDLISGNLINPISVNEYGSTNPVVGVWTGTYANTKYYSVTCLNWTAWQGKSYEWGSMGCSDSKTITWTNCAWASCNEHAHIYCFEK